MALTDNLISYWTLDEASGTRADSHGSNDLTDNNTVASAAGKISNAGDFEKANNEYLSHADNADLSFSGADPFTISAWVNLESNDGTMNVVAKFNAAGDTGGYFLRYNQGLNRFDFRVGADDGASGTNLGQVQANNFGAPSTATWYFLVAWHDPVNDVLGISVNGTVNTNAHATNVFDDAGSFCIGRLGDFNGQYWDGLIDEVGLWNRVLTSDERAELYAGGSGLAYPFSSAAPVRRLTLLGVGA